MWWIIWSMLFGFLGINLLYKNNATPSDIIYITLLAGTLIGVYEMFSYMTEDYY